MLVLKTSVRAPVGLGFSANGAALLAFGTSAVQVWPDWLSAPPRPLARVGTQLERAALTPDGAHALLYLSGNSRTKVLTVARGTARGTAVPAGGPAWFGTDAAGAFVLVSHGRGSLSRYDWAPAGRARLRKAWTVERRTDAGLALGTHYRFGAVCPGGAFVGLEYVKSGGEPFDGLVVRAAADGALVLREPLQAADYRKLLSKAGLELAVRPGGAFFAFPDGAAVAFRTLTGPAPGPLALPHVSRPRGKPKPAGPARRPALRCTAVAYDATGARLLAGRSDGAVTLFDAAAERPLRTLDWGIGRVGAVCFTPDGTRAAAIGSTGRVVVWDADE